MTERLSADRKDHVVVQGRRENYDLPCCLPAAVDSARSEVKGRVSSACGGASELPVRMSLGKWIEWSKGQEK